MSFEEWYEKEPVTDELTNLAKALYYSHKKFVSLSWNHQQKTIDKQAERIKELTEALDFYADTENWTCQSVKRGNRFIKISDMEMIDCNGKWGGKRARQALKEVQGV
jgi:urease accessory protein UreF